MSLDVSAYKGGSMSLANFQFSNTGGDKTGFLSFVENISRNFGCGSKSEAQDIGEITYHKPSQTLYFNEK